VKKWERDRGDVKKVTFKKMVAHYGIVVIIICLIPLFYRCPIYTLFHIPCPGCGLTRASLSALRLDFKSALAYHPLFFILPLLMLYVFFRDAFKLKLNPKTEKFVFIVVLMAFLVTYVIRLFITTL